MTDSLADTPCLARRVCLSCEPDADPAREILEIRYCAEHELRTDGADDARVNRDRYLSGTAEAGGEDNRAACDLLHRRRVLLRGPA